MLIQDITGANASAADSNSSAERKAEAKAAKAAESARAAEAAKASKAAKKAEAAELAESAKAAKAAKAAKKADGTPDAKKRGSAGTIEPETGESVPASPARGESAVDSAAAGTTPAAASSPAVAATPTPTPKAVSTAARTAAPSPAPSSAVAAASTSGAPQRTHTSETTALRRSGSMTSLVSVAAEDIVSSDKVRGSLLLTVEVVPAAKRPSHLASGTGARPPKHGAVVVTVHGCENLTASAPYIKAYMSKNGVDVKRTKTKSDYGPKGSHKLHLPTVLELDIPSALAVGCGLGRAGLRRIGMLRET